MRSPFCLRRASHIKLCDPANLQENLKCCRFNRPHPIVVSSDFKHYLGFEVKENVELGHTIKSRWLWHLEKSRAGSPSQLSREYPTKLSLKPLENYRISTDGHGFQNTRYPAVWNSHQIFTNRGVATCTHVRTCLPEGGGGGRGSVWNQWLWVPLKNSWLRPWLNISFNSPKNSRSLLRNLKRLQTLS